jgi:hypothetical protein
LSTKTEARILILGARAPVALDLARACARLGVETHLADPLKFPLALGSSSVKKMHRVASPRHAFTQFKNDILNITTQYRITHIIPTCEEAFYLSQMKDDLPTSVKVWVPDFIQMKKLHHKSDFNTWVKELGFVAPKTETFSSAEELHRRLKELASSGMWVLKPAYSRFASKARIGYAWELFSQVPEIIVSPENPYLLQECIEGREYCTYAWADEGRLVAISTYHHEFRAGQGAGICFEPVFHPGIEAWIKNFVSQTQLSGQVSFDFIENTVGKIHPLECNPRSTSGLHLLTPEDAFIRAIIGLETPTEVIRPKTGSRAMLGLAMWVYGLPSIRSLTRLKAWSQIMVFSRDCVFSWRDLLPFFTQFLTFGFFFLQAKKLSISELEATTEDIEWNGEPISSV